MQKKYEKRKAARYRLYADISYSFFHSERPFGCKMLNQSRGGICFQTGYELQPGTQIMIYPEDFSSKGPAEKRTEGIRARVCWCANLPEFNAFFYKIGVAYE